MKKKLGELCVAIASVDPRKFKRDSFKYIDISSVDNRTKRISGAKEISIDQTPSRARKLVRSGDVLVATTRPALNAVAQISPDFDGAVASTGFCVLRTNEELDPSYLFHYVRSDAFVDSLAALVTGALYPAVSDKDVLGQEIQTPSLSDQRRIAATLDSQLSFIEEARQAAERRVKAAADMEAALFREFFHGITPVVIGTPKDAAPAGWAWQRLTKLAVLESGHTPSRKHPEWWGGEIPWIALPDIRALDGKVALDTKENTNPLGIANSSARILPPGTVMLSRTASVGFVAMMGHPMATSQDFVNWVCGDKLAPRFLMHALRASREYLLANASGAIHKTIYMPAAREFHLCLPERKRQDTLTAHLDSQLADAATLLAAARAELAAIQALPAAVLRRIFDA